MTTLVFGTTGMVARALGQTAGSRAFMALSRSDADLFDPAACATAIEAVRPSAVINAAAYTAVDKAEGEEEIARVVNAAAPAAMAAICAAFEIPFLHLSTDYVFDGAGTVPRQPDDPTRPINAYGRTKLAGEMAIRETGARHAILRTSWVFSEHGANFLRTMLRLADTRDALRVVGDQIGGPTPARGIAEALWTITDALIDGHGGGTFHYSGAPDISWAGFAGAIFEEAAREVTVTGIPTSEYPTPAARPLNSRLDCSRTTSEFGLERPMWREDVTRITRLLT
ncbi:MAG: dTDP-4-dehydrorhamnose reductase [Pseudomonadota bacterium]